jgi:hypothetical protein
MRQARVWDGVRENGRKYVSRALVPPEETARVLAYLEEAPIVLAARGYDTDEKDPSRGANVPMTFHTDGEWIWPGAVAYYLRTHEIPPEPDLVAHIRARAFELPVVDEHTRDVAVSVITGAPMPTRAPEPAAPRPSPSQPSAAEEQQRELEEEARQVLEETAFSQLRRRLGELGVDPAVYRVGEVADDAWCLTHDDDGWSVFWSERGGRHNAVRFATADQAAAHLLGTLVIVPSRMRGPEQPAGPTAAPNRSATDATERAPSGGDAAIHPLPGEPPLTLLRDRRSIELPAGTVVDRFGTPGGNLVYAARTPYENRSLPPEWINSGYHVYRLQRPLRALTGVAVPWFEQPGGGTAYVLPRSVQDLLDDGTLVEVREP